MRIKLPAALARSLGHDLPAKATGGARAREKRTSRKCGPLLPMPRVRLVLPMPPSANVYYRRVGSKTLISAAGRTYRKRVADAVASAGECLRPGRVAVAVVVSPPDRRRRDLDNVFKAVGDALTHAGVWADDSLVDDLRLVRSVVTVGGNLTVTATVIPEQGIDQ